LNTLLTQNPHHPLVLHELATTYEEQENWRALESLGQGERGDTRASLLLSHEYATALEQLKRTRDAAQVVVETWLVSPGEAEWARQTLARLARAAPQDVGEDVGAAAGGGAERGASL